MTVRNLLAMIEKVDPEVFDRLNSRRGAVRHFSSFSKRTALTALPFALGSLFKKAYAQSTNPEVEAVLQFALTLEYLEAEFYTLALGSPALIPQGAALNAITTIRDQEDKHVSFLKTTLEGLGKTPVSKPEFDFSGGKGTGQGAFPSVFTNYDTFLSLAQTFEDTGVRAYKGQAAELLGAGEVLTSILKIHSVEARHASHIRQMRHAGGANVKPWITGKENDIGAAVQSSYDGEEADTQGGISISAINGFPITTAAATESFDEPLSRERVLAIIDPFIVS
ncbi:ferritin-like domain-containing protein [Flavihumibacter sp. R14]|nr:ferritin-like domain-containing protein [Flavihumibacter soli]